MCESYVLLCRALFGYEGQTNVLKVIEKGGVCFTQQDDINVVVGWEFFMIV